MREKQKLDRRDAHTHGKLILIKGGEKKMDISTKKVRIYGVLEINNILQTNGSVDYPVPGNQFYCPGKCGWRNFQ